MNKVNINEETIDFILDKISTNLCETKSQIKNVESKIIKEKKDGNIERFERFEKYLLILKVKEYTLHEIYFSLLKMQEQQKDI